MGDEPAATVAHVVIQQLDRPSRRHLPPIAVVRRGRLRGLARLAPSVQARRRVHRPITPRERRLVTVESLRSASGDRIDKERSYAEDAEAFGADDVVACDDGVDERTKDLN